MSVLAIAFLSSTAGLLFAGFVDGLRHRRQHRLPRRAGKARRP